MKLPKRKNRFHLERKQVAVVRYYETMHVITDGAGERVYAGSDETTAMRILRALNHGVVGPGRAWPKVLRKRKYRKGRK